MTDPANAASREARAIELYAQAFERAGDHHAATCVRKREECRRLNIGHAVPLHMGVSIAAIVAALADEAASQPREADIDELLRRVYETHPITAITPALTEAVALPLNAPIPYEVSVAAGCDHSGLRRIVEATVRELAALHDTAPTDQAQGGGTPEPAPQDNAEIVERCARIAEEHGNAHDTDSHAESGKLIAAAIRALATPIQGEI